MEKIAVGLVVKPQGIKGELKVRPLINDPDWLSTLKYVYISGEDGKRAVLSVSVRFGFAYIMLDGIADMSTAELFRDKELLVLKEDAYKPGADEYFIEELIDLKIMSADGTMLGRVKRVENFGASDVITAHTIWGEVMFPFLGHIVLDINLTDEQMTVDKEKLLEVINPSEV